MLIRNVQINKTRLTFGFPPNLVSGLVSGLVCGLASLQISFSALAQSSLPPEVPDGASAPWGVREDGLEIGNNLSHVSLTGHVKITCEDYLIDQSSEFDCSKETLEPALFSRFQTANVVNADHFDLKIEHEHSWSRYKSGVYVPSSGTSDISLNLWHFWIFDLPILNDGINRASYQLSREGKVVTQGSFIVNVAHVQRSCQTASIVSHDPGDCQHRHDACGRYFFQNNDCR